ncbi:MAG: manganese efflux pump [Oscillospiraceae bacterium]|nr:manganese efflux pump [Oscillospiraceae bacterium]
MPTEFMFYFTNLMLGIGLAMDAFSVSLANGLNESYMRLRKMVMIAGIFGVFQGLMPMLGWVCLHYLVQVFGVLEELIPWIALGLLSYIGAKMILDSIKCENKGICNITLTLSALLLQGIATSIDALSVGFAIVEYSLTEALLAAALIAAVTFVICFAGIVIGKKVGTKLAGKAGIFGGVILILIGIEIFVTSFF